MTLTSELHTRGAAHQRAGTIDRELEREDSPVGRAYRDGMRQARREAEDGGGDHCEDCDPSFGCWNGTDAICRKSAPRVAEEKKWKTIETAPANGTPVDVLCGDKIYMGKLEGIQWYGSARILGTNKVSWHPMLAPDGWRRLQFAPREAKEAAARTSPAPGSVEHTSPNQPPPRPPQPETIFALPKPAKRPKKPASAAEQLDLL